MIRAAFAITLVGLSVFSANADACAMYIPDLEEMRVAEAQDQDENTENAPAEDAEAPAPTPIGLADLFDEIDLADEPTPTPIADANADANADINADETIEQNAPEIEGKLQS